MKLIFYIIISWLLISTGYALRQLYNIFRAPKDSPKNFLKNNNELHNPKEKIIFIGDSLTHGTMSINYINMIKKNLGEKKYTYINAGINGDHTYNILSRIQDIINCQPDIAIVLAGTNDALGIYFKNLIKSTMKRKNLIEIPSDEVFIKNMNQIIQKLKEKTSAKIILLSIPPFGENPNTKAFALSKRYSNILENIAKEKNITFLPVFRKMKEKLNQKNDGTSSNPKYSFQDFHKLVALAPMKKIFLFKSFDRISKDWGFNLLIDQIHLNSKGAKVIAELIINLIQSKNFNGNYSISK